MKDTTLKKKKKKFLREVIFTHSKKKEIRKKKEKRMGKQKNYCLNVLGLQTLNNTSKNCIFLFSMSTRNVKEAKEKYENILISSMKNPFIM
jgi:hypothetical protein